MIRVGLVGLGGITRSHLDAYRELECVRLVAAADIRGEESPRYEMARELGAKIYTSLDDMLEHEQLDMLDVCTPTPLHAEMVKKGLSLGLNVLSEKPMCRTSEEGEELVRLARESRGKYMVAHVVRFMKPYAYLRGIIASGELGRPVHIALRRLSSVPRWSYGDWMIGTKDSGGAPLDLSIHDIDFIYSIFGEPREVTGSYRAFSGKEGFAANDYLSAELIYDGLSVNIIGAQYDTALPFTAEYIAVFERGVVELRGGKVYRCGEEIDLEAAENEGEDTGINISSSSAYTDEIAYFAAAVESGTDPDLVKPESSLGSVKLVERILDRVVRV